MGSSPAHVLYPLDTKEKKMDDCTCSTDFNCCDCGGVNCGCAYCFSCNACDVCNPTDNDDEGRP